MIEYFIIAMYFVTYRCGILFRRGSAEKKILEKAKELRDMIEISGDKRLNMAEIRQMLREISRDVARLSEIERDRLARQIDDLFEEKIAILRGWRESRVRKIRSMLKEISIMKKVPKTKFVRVKMLDNQIKLDDAVLHALENIRDILIDTVQRGVDPETAWNKVFRVTEVVTGYVEGLTERAEAFTEIAEEEVSEAEVQELFETHGVAEP
ncbi:MAG: hypothetical protein Q6363_003875, partial [Candidatus Njordarchaeota archaeon]